MTAPACDCCLSAEYEGATDEAWGGSYLCVMCQPCPGCAETGGPCPADRCIKPTEEAPVPTDPARPADDLFDTLANR